MAQRPAPAQIETREHVERIDISPEDIIAGLALTVIVLSVAWGVITRYLLAQPASWTVETATIAFAWLVFVGAAAAFNRNEHIAIDLVVELLPEAAQRIARGFADALMLAILLVVTVLAARLSLATLDAPTTILRLPQSVIYSAAVAGFLLMSVRHGVRLLARMRHQETA